MDADPDPQPRVLYNVCVQKENQLNYCTVQLYCWSRRKESESWYSCSCFYYFISSLVRVLERERRERVLPRIQVGCKRNSSKQNQKKMKQKHVLKQLKKNLILSLKYWFCFRDVRDICKETICRETPTRNARHTKWKKVAQNCFSSYFNSPFRLGRSWTVLVNYHQNRLLKITLFQFRYRFYSLKQL